MANRAHRRAGSLNPASRRPPDRRFHDLTRPAPCPVEATYGQGKGSGISRALPLFVPVRSKVNRELTTDTVWSQNIRLVERTRFVNV
jgi:hypothetical protein